MTSPKRIQKEQIIEDLKGKVSRAKSVVLADYRGLSTAQISDLRKKLRETDAEFVITKNTLLGKALQTVNCQLSTVNSLTGPTAILFAFGDEISPLKTLVNFAKSLKLPQIKLGIFNQEIFSAEKLEQLAKLPSRDVLIGQLIQTINNPLSRLTKTLKWNMQKLVLTLKALEKSKS